MNEETAAVLGTPANPAVTPTGGALRPLGELTTLPVGPEHPGHRSSARWTPSRTRSPG